MRQIFQNTAITISAARAGSNRSGFLSSMPARPASPLPVMLSNGDVGTLQVSKNQNKYQGLAIDPISHRGWTLEEQLLSNRILEFPSTTDAAWHCVKQRLTNIGKVGDLTLIRLSNTWFPWGFRLPWSMRIGLPTNEDFQGYWAEIIRDFTLRVTHESDDRLNAIGGLAQEMNRDMAYTYYAGMWGHETLRHLLWWGVGDQFDESSHPCSMATSYRAPSWSWASLEGQIQLPY